MYGVNNGATTPMTITLPQAAIGNVGTFITFRRLFGSGSTTVVNITTTGGTQTMYNLANVGQTSHGFLTSGTYINRICSMYNGSTYNWYFI